MFYLQTTGLCSGQYFRVHTLMISNTETRNGTPTSFDLTEHNQTTCKTRCPTSMTDEMGYPRFGGFVIQAGRTLILYAARGVGFGVAIETDQQR